MHFVKINARYVKRVLQGLFLALCEVRRYCDCDVAVIFTKLVLGFDLAEDVGQESSSDLFRFDALLNMWDSNCAACSVKVKISVAFLDL